jgi:hypothetical protein
MSLALLLSVSLSSLRASNPFIKIVRYDESLQWRKAVNRRSMDVTRRNDRRPLAGVLATDV